jgi:hypothetical protein
MSAIGAQVQPLAPFSGKACCLLLGEGEGEVDGEVERRITAPIAPGLMAELQVREHRLFGAGETLEIGLVPSVIALDGEREVFIRKGSKHSVRYNAKGPLVVDIRKSLQLASGRGYLNVSGPSG